MKITFTSIVLSAGLITSAFAQPVLTYNSSHSIGVQSSMYLATTTANVLQQTGANITWDLSGANLTPIGTWDLVDPATAPHGANYPSSNLAFKQDITGQEIGYIFLIDDPSALNSIAADDGTGSPTIWTQYDKLVQYPFNYGDAFTATRQQSGDAPETFTRTYDAYGTLIIHGKTYTNVIRVNKSNGSAVWFTTSPEMFPIMIQASSTSCRYNEPANFTGVNETLSNKPIHMYPNPCNDVLTIESSTDQLQYQVMNTFGQVLETGSLMNNQVNTANLQKGIYVLMLTDKSKGVTYKTFLKN